MKPWKQNTALFLLSQATTLIGSSLVGFAIMWHVNLVTKSGAMMTVFTAATMLPMVVTSIFGGIWADRYNRKLLINIADASIAAVTLAIAVLFSLGADNIYLLLLCSAIRSLAQGIQMPAVSALIPLLAPPEHLVRVNAANSAIQSVSMLATPAAAGALLALAPIQAILYIDVATAAIGITILALLVKVPVLGKAGGEAAGGNTPPQSTRAIKTDFVQGLSYIGAHPFIKRMFIVIAVFGILLTPCALLTPLQVIRDFGEGVWRLTTIEIAFSAGMLVGGIAMSAWGGFKNRIHTIAAGMLASGLLAAMLGITGNFTAYTVCMAAVGLSVPFINAPGMAILQTKVDPAYIGRVFGVMTMVSGVAMPFGMFIIGPLADRVSIDLLLIATGTGTALLGAFIFADKTLKQAGST